MTTQQFDLLRADMSTLRESIVQTKRPEYTEGHTDVLHNFKVVAEELGITPVQVWYVYFRKHIASISQYAKGGVPLSESLHSRVADAMNYLDLLNALDAEANPNPNV